MNLQVYLSEDKQKLTLCDAEGKCEVFGKVEGVHVIAQRKHHKWLSDDLKGAIAKRYINIPDSLETVAEIARDFGINRKTVFEIGRKHGSLPLNTMKKILKLSTDPMFTSQDIADLLNVDLTLVNKTIARHRALPWIKK